MRHVYFLTLVSLSFGAAIGMEQQCSLREQQLIEHAKWGISQAENGRSKLSSATLAVPGMTSHKVKHLLNNLCTLPQTSYLEIGVWKGATFTAALSGNKDTIQQAAAIDNWSKFEGPEQEFKNNCRAHISDIPYQFYSEESFTIDPKKLFDKSVDIYFYDGDHSELSQERAFTYYDSILASSFIAIVDDWCWSEVKSGTRKAFEKLGYTVLFEQELPARFNGDTELWWNGIYVAVIRRNK